MHYYFTAVSLVAGICLGFGILYLFIGLRRKENKPLYLTFALFALCYAATLFNGIRWYSTNIVSEYLAINRFDAIFVAGAFISLIWYISHYTDFRPRIFLWVLSAALLVPSLVFIISPATFTGEVSGLTYIILPWGENLNDLDSAGSVWLDILLLARLVTLGYIILALIQQFRRGERQPAIILGLGTLPFITGIFYEVLGESGFVPYIPFGEFGFLGIAIAASLQMSISVINTEEALEQHRHNLEGLVDERTEELERSNFQLTQEITNREQAEAALRESERRARALLDAPPDSALLTDLEGRILDINEIAAERLGISIQDGQGINVFDLFEPPVAETRRSKADELILTKKPVAWEDKREGKYYENRLFPIIDDEGNVTSIAVYGADISERYRAEEALRQRIEDLNFLNQIGHIVTSTANLPIALQSLAELITRHYEARYTHIIFRATESDDLKYMVGYDFEIGPIGQTQIDVPLEEIPLIGRVLDSGESLVDSEIQKIHWDPAVREFLHEYQIQCLMLIPIKLRGEIVGVVAVTCNQVDRHFSEDEIQLAETIAADISRVVDSTWLQEKERQAAAGEERSRLARDLHDAVTQTIYSASLIAQVLPTVWERSPTEGQRNLVKLRQLVRGALGEMRTLLFELRPASLEAADLTTLLRHLGDALTGRSRIPVTFQTAGESHPPTEVKIAFYRIAQEAFNNIAKHSEATQAIVELQSDSNQVKLSVRDDGRGFDQNNVAEDKLGIQIMTERANDIDARLELNTTPGKGTQISLTWSGEEYNNAQTLD